jgi:2-oxo-4-hydroxy-4-carboxy-5-ureidoimidazoline decarboxylase
VKAANAARQQQRAAAGGAQRGGALSPLNGLDRKSFAQQVGPVFEGSPWIAERAWSRRPFATLSELHQALCDVVLASSRREKLRLIRAHPDLGARSSRSAELTDASMHEQAGAGLGKLGATERARFQEYNRLYRARFGFPFVICARLSRKESILAAFERRLKHGQAAEIETALEEIVKIAGLRLRDLVVSPPARLTTHVLDTVHGCPAKNLRIELWSLSGARRRRLKTVRTNAQGRTADPLLAGAELVAGEYELVFFVGDYFAEDSRTQAGRRFLDRVPVRFGIAEANSSYHVPMLCSPWAYSTYRGS